MLTAVSNAVRFLTNNPGDCFETLRYGVEIEFSDAGDLRQEVCPEYDEDYAEEYLCSDPLEVLCACVPHLTTDAARVIFRNHGRDLPAAVEGITGDSDRWHQLVNDMVERLNEERDIEEEWKDVWGWNNKEEGTKSIVREYVTSGPNDFAKTRELVEQLMEEAGDCEVPLDGACHVHVSFPGCVHSLTENSVLQCCILHELLMLSDEFPDKVWDRIQEDDGYFRLNSAPTEKFSVIHSHRQGTLEFRLFGHLTEPAEIMNCVRIAGLSMIRGYRRFLENRYHISDVATFRKLARSFLMDDVSAPVTHPQEWSEELVNPIAARIGTGAVPQAEVREEVDTPSVSRGMLLAMLGQSLPVQRRLFTLPFSELFTPHPDSCPDSCPALPCPALQLA